MVAAVFEAEMSREQAGELARLMAEGRATRPAAVLSAALTYEDGRAALIAYWPDRQTLDDYLATSVPRGVELMRRVGVEPTTKVVDVLELG